MITVREIKSVDDFHTFKDLQGDELHIVKLSTPWCGPCKMLASTISNLDPEKIGTALFAEVNIDTDETEDISVELGIRGVPVLVYYKNGEELKRTVGLVSAEDIYNAINELQ